MVRWLRERGLQAQGFATEYGDEDEPAATAQGEGAAA